MVLFLNDLPTDPRELLTIERADATFRLERSSD